MQSLAKLPTSIFMQIERERRRGGRERGGGWRGRWEKEGGVGGEKGEAEKHYMKDQLLTK